jgi:hypothetical protein
MDSLAQRTSAFQTILEVTTAGTFETSQDSLSKLAAEARADRIGGRATDVDPDRCELARDTALLGSVRRL